MNKTLTLLALAALLGGTAFSMLAQAPATVAAAAPTVEKALDGSAMAEQVDALLALPAKERRARLKAMSADERRGLWFQLKRTQAERRGAERKSYKDRIATPRAGKARPTTKAPGTIQYDDGVISTAFGGGELVGNRFDTHTGGMPVANPGTVETVVAVVVEGTSITTSSAGFVMFGPLTGGGGAMAIFSTFTSASGATSTVTFGGLGVSYTGSSFFVLFGDFSSSYIPAMGTGTNNGQGHHGVVGYTGGMGPNIASTGTLGGALNGLIRVTGNVLPVELMDFTVE